MLDSVADYRVYNAFVGEVLAENEAKQAEYKSAAIIRASAKDR
jgi:hypothetical protein